MNTRTVTPPPLLVILCLVIGVGLSGCSLLKSSRQQAGVVTATPENLSVIKRQERDKVAFPVPQSTVGDTAGVALPDVETSTLITDVSANDSAFAEDALVRALESGRVGSRINWRNPSTGNSGEILPGLKLKVEGRDCRQFSHIIRKDGKSSQVTKTACKANSGTWQELTDN